MSPPCPGGDGYVYRVGDVSGWDAAYFDKPDAADYYVQTYLYLPVDGEKVEWERLGLFLRGQNCPQDGHRNSYVITMDTDDGHTRAAQYVNGEIKAFRDHVYSKQGWYKLRIVAKGNLIRFFIDDQLFWEQRDDQYQRGSFGFCHYESGSEETVHYTCVDNFEAGSWPPPPPKPGNVMMWY